MNVKTKCFSYCDIFQHSDKMAQNGGLLVDVEVEPPKSEGVESVKDGLKSVTLGAVGGEVNSNTKNMFEEVDAIQTYQNASESDIGEVGRQRINSVTSNHSIRSYDSTGTQPFLFKIMFYQVDCLYI